MHVASCFNADVVRVPKTWRCLPIYDALTIQMLSYMYLLNCLDIDDRSLTKIIGSGHRIPVGTPWNRMKPISGHYQSYTHPSSTPTPTYGTCSRPRHMSYYGWLRIFGSPTKLKLLRLNPQCMSASAPLTPSNPLCCTNRCCVWEVPYQDIDGHFKEKPQDFSVHPEQLLTSKRMGPCRDMMGIYPTDISVLITFWFFELAIRVAMC
jgi:hypothetical protein